ncbi:MAG: hypothetical protein JW995_00315 [Melioribacteraceae bacterium]|nr:hypothetical protein [Melioribacteraceae bacterium]
MPESSKYDLFMDELLSLEKQIGVFAQRCDELVEQNNYYKDQIFNMEQENQALKNKIKEIEIQLSKQSNNEDLFGGNSLTAEDREQLKEKVGELINKIDHHLRS